MATGYSQAEQRKIAAGAARSQMRRMGIDPRQTTPADALAVLDDISRQDKTLVCSAWYCGASDRQIQKFNREWSM